MSVDAGDGAKWRKERESDPQGREPRPRSRGVPSPVGLPFREVVVPEGVEPSRLAATGSEPAMSTVSSGDCEVADSQRIELWSAMKRQRFSKPGPRPCRALSVKWCAQPELNRRLPGFNRALEPSQLQAREVDGLRDTRLSHARPSTPSRAQQSRVNGRSGHSGRDRTGVSGVAGRSIAPLPRCVKWLDRQDLHPLPEA